MCGAQVLPSVMFELKETDTKLKEISQSYLFISPSKLIICIQNIAKSAWVNIIYMMY